MKGFSAVWILFPLAVTAAEPELGDFAAGFEITTEDSAALYQVSLPADVYSTVTRDDLGDVRVFNGAKEIIPHAVRHRGETESTVTVRTDVPFFPLPNVSADNDSKLDITLRDDGAIIAIRTENAAEQVDADQINRYILDLSSLQSNVDALEFTLISSERNYLRQARLEASADLNHWAPYVENAALTSLHYAGHDLVQNRITLNGGKPQYLRFTWQDKDGGQIKIMDVRATLDNRTTHRERNWSTVTGTGSRDKGIQIYDFDTGGLFPVEQVNILLPDDNSLIEATLKSRKSDKGNWRVHDQGLFFHLNMKGAHVERGPVSIGLTTDRYWRLEVKNEDGMGSAPPQMKFAWQANELYFLARGKGPFILAYGNADAVAPGKPVDALMRALGDEQQSGVITTAALGRAVQLKGADALKPGMKIYWQRILMWSVLVFGVLVIAVITLRLYKQMGKPA